MRRADVDGDGVASPVGRGVTATVLSRVYYGADTLVELGLEGSDQVVLSRRHSLDAPHVGEVVAVAVAGPVVAYRA